MAYIYRYHLKDSKLREITTLMDYHNDIQKIINDYYGSNLKESLVEEKYFEFKLYSTVSNSMLRNMGRELKAGLPHEIRNSGFIRMKQKFYALVYPPENEENNDFHIEFVDSIVIDDSMLYTERAKNFFEKQDMDAILSDRIDQNMVTNIMRNYYLDILESYVDVDSIPKDIANIEELECYYIEGYHRRNSAQQLKIKEDKKSLFFEKCFDVHGIGKTNEFATPDAEIDYLDIYRFKKQDIQTIKKIKNELQLILPSTGKIEVLDKIEESVIEGSHKYYKFRVHNVGQAQATSLAHEEEAPILYFDYGMPYGNNKKTIPTDINMPVSADTTIILSHIHKDHWWRVYYDKDSLYSTWIIPEQPRKTQFNHAISGIISRGGTVQTINKNIIYSWGSIECGGVSRMMKDRKAKTAHETGISLRLNSKDNSGNNANILIPGDKKYDYMSNKQLNDVNILVATHHGGKYSWSVNGNVPVANDDESILVYSYGEKNSHNHPSKINDYNKGNWKKEHHTSTNGDFEIAIRL